MKISKKNISLLANIILLGLLSSCRDEHNQSAHYKIHNNPEGQYCHAIYHDKKDYDADHDAFDHEMHEFEERHGLYN